MSDKPTVPTSPFDPWPRMTVDRAAPHFTRIVDLAATAAHAWVLGTEGPFQKRAMTQAQITEESIRQGLLHLFELGLIDIDYDRFEQAEWTPMTREQES